MAGTNTVIDRKRPARCFSFSHTFLLFIGICVASVAMAQNGTVKGKISAADGKPAEAVSVVLENTRYGAVSTAAGVYEIRNVKPGNYSLAISTLGVLDKKQAISITAGQTLEIDLTIDRTSKELAEIIVTARQSKVTQKESDQIARMPLANLQNPQVYSVVNKELMKEQIVTNILDGLKSAAGVMPTYYPSGGIGVTARGFATEIGARNGLQSTLGRMSADVSNIERIEFIKGPSGALFGAGISSFGGVVNLVTKKPYEKTAASVDLAMGSFGLARLSADVNTPLNEEKSVLLRVNGAVQRQNNFTQFGFNNSVAVAPSLLYKASDKLTIHMDAELYSVNSTRPTYTIVNPSSGYKSFKELPLGFRTSLYDNDLDAKSQSQKFFVEAKYKIYDNWTSSTNVSYVNEQVDYSYQTYNTWVGPNQVSRWAGIWGPVRNTYTNAQQNFTGKFNTGFLKHTLLVGLNYTNYTSDGMSKSSDDFDVVDVTNPSSFKVVNKVTADEFLLKSGNVNQWGRITNDFLAAYVSDVININDRLFAMLSLRADRYIQTLGGLWGGPYDQNALSPKLGLVYQVVKKKVSIFGNYMSGFQNNGPITQPDGVKQLVPDPVYAKQWEAGVKTELWNNKLNSTISYYHIAIDNAIRYDTASYAFQDGKQVSKGFEWELLANPVAGLSVMLGYGYNDNKIVDTKAGESDIVTGAPKHTANAWVSYRFTQGALKNFGVGAGGNHVSDCYFNYSVTIPAYTVVNASVFFENEKIKIGAKLNNMGNKKYWDNWGIYNPTRNFVADLSIKF